MSPTAILLALKIIDLGLLYFEQSSAGAAKFKALKALIENLKPEGEQITPEAMALLDAGIDADLAFIKSKLSGGSSV